MMNLLTILQNDFSSAYAFSAVIGASVLAITQVVKQTVPMPKQYVPYVSIVLGVVIAFLTKSDVDMATRLLGGAIAGFTATGMFEAIFNKREGVTEVKDIKAGFLQLVGLIKASFKKAPKAEAPKVDAPKADAPKAEVPKVDAPQK